MIDYARSYRVETITLFAGDRDFIDAILYARDNLKKDVCILAFEENLAARIKQSGAAIINISNYLYWLQRYTKKQEVKVTQKRETKQYQRKGSDINQATIVKKNNVLQ